MHGTSPTIPLPVAEYSPRLLFGLFNAMALGTMFWSACWWLVT